MAYSDHCMWLSWPYGDKIDMVVRGNSSTPLYTKECQSYSHPLSTHNNT